jgi:hypothetical protein
MDKLAVRLWEIFCLGDSNNCQDRKVTILSVKTTDYFQEIAFFHIIGEEFFQFVAFFFLGRRIFSRKSNKRKSRRKFHCLKHI